MSSSHPLPEGRAQPLDRDVWLRTAAGIGQLTLGTWLLVAWLVQGPRWLIGALVVASAVLGFASLARWRWRT